MTKVMRSGSPVGVDRAYLSYSSRITRPRGTNSHGGQGRPSRHWPERLVNHHSARKRAPSRTSDVAPHENLLMISECIAVDAYSEQTASIRSHVMLPSAVCCVIQRLIDNTSFLGNRYDCISDRHQKIKEGQGIKLVTSSTSTSFSSSHHTPQSYKNLC